MWVSGTIWFYTLLTFMLIATFIKMLGLVEPRDALTITLLTNGLGVLLGSILSVLIMKYTLKIDNPAFWTTLGNIGKIVGVENLPYILTAIVSIVVWDLAVTPIRTRLSIVRVGAGGGYAYGGVQSYGLSFGVPATPNQIVVLDTIGKQAVKTYKQQIKKAKVKPIKDKKLDVKGFTKDIKSVVMTTRGQNQPRPTPNVWESERIQDLKEVVIRDVRTEVNPELIGRNFERRRDEIDDIIEKEQTETLRVIDDPNEIVMIAYTTLVRHLITNFNIPPSDAGDESRYQLLSRKKKGDIWEFTIRYTVNPFTSYDFAVYVDKFGRSEVVLINVA